MLVVATNDGIRGISFQVSSGASSAGSASVVELALVAAGLIGILLFLTMGGSQAVGDWLAGLMQFGGQKGHGLAA
jgi:hypothetical protein